MLKTVCKLVVVVFTPTLTKNQTVIGADLSAWQSLEITRHCEALPKQSQMNFYPSLRGFAEAISNKFLSVIARL